MMKKVFFVCLIGVLLIVGVFIGCASTGGNKLYSEFMLPSIPKEEHAVLIVDSYIDITQVNGQYLFTLSGSSTRQIIPLPAGKYDLQVYYQRTEDLGMYSTGTEIGRMSATTNSTDLTLISYDFAPGLYYLLSAEPGGNIITYKIDEIKDNNQAMIVEASNLVGKAKVKEPTPWSIGYVKREPTKFEGIWKSDDGSYVMSFTGNTIVWTPKTGTLRGNFDFTDDTLTIYMTGMYNGNQWIASPVKQNYKFNYTLGPGVLNLLERGSSLPLRKQSN
jgi:hypothetical protein